ncbi:hypothetical protein HDU96_008174 [Phlyctochytrium bullatum]|nr:hypothetical protein HDU96_008174 [Phlyctochytrium bullatum]
MASPQQPSSSPSQSHEHTSTSTSTTTFHHSTTTLASRTPTPTTTTSIDPSIPFFPTSPGEDATTATSLAAGTIVAISLAAVAFLAVLVILIAFLLWRKRAAEDLRLSKLQLTGTTRPAALEAGTARPSVDAAGPKASSLINHQALSDLGASTAPRLSDADAHCVEPRKSCSNDLVETSEKDQLQGSQLFLDVRRTAVARSSMDLANPPRPSSAPTPPSSLHRQSTSLTRPPTAASSSRKPPPTIPLPPIPSTTPAPSPLATWSPDQVEAWLLECGFHRQMAQKFREAGIDGAELSALTAEELRARLGVGQDITRSSLEACIMSLRVAEARRLDDRVDEDVTLGNLPPYSLS